MMVDTPRKLFRMKVRLLNNRLVRAREELGLSQTEAARQIGIGNSHLSAFENLGRTANGAGKAWTGEGWTPSALKIAAFYGYSPEYLWPEEVDAVRKSALTLELSAQDVRVFVGGELEARELASRVREAKKLLPPEQARVLDEKFLDEKTYEQIGEGRVKRYGEEVGKSRERVRQLVEQARGNFIRAYEKLEREDEKPAPRSTDRQSAAREET